MRVYFSEQYRLHSPRTELCGGRLVSPSESEVRVENILMALREHGFDDIQPPESVLRSRLEKIHAPDYLRFLQTAWQEWVFAGHAGEIIADTHVGRGMSPRHAPQDIDGKVGYYSFASETSMVEGTWRGALSSASVAESAARHVAQAGGVAFALCRPPGHHAGGDYYGGYCFLNNAALAAQVFCDGGAKRVGVLDIDFHHGNGTQAIFYGRGDVFFVSLHGHPDYAFPYFMGYAEETGEGSGVGATANYPLMAGTDYGVWKLALEDSLKRLKAFGCEALVVSLGVDTYFEDPIGFFELESDDYVDCGECIGSMRLPTVFVLEGGYAISAVGVNVVNVLKGFLGS